MAWTNAILLFSMLLMNIHSNIYFLFLAHDQTLSFSLNIFVSVLSSAFSFLLAAFHCPIICFKNKKTTTKFTWECERKKHKKNPCFRNRISKTKGSTKQKSIWYYIFLNFVVDSSSFKRRRRRRKKLMYSYRLKKFIIQVIRHKST